MTIRLDFQTIKNLKTPGRFTDALVRGLHIWVKPNGSKYWIFRYSHAGIQHNTSLGAFPAISVAEARIKAQQARDNLNKGVNPVALKRAAKVEKLAADAKRINFRDFANTCILAKRAEWTNQKHGDQWEYTLREFAYPVIGHKALEEIDTEDILKILIPPLYL